MSRSTREAARRLAAAALLAAALAALLAWVAAAGRAVPLPAAPEARLPCVSYAPFRRAGHTPFDAALVVPRAAIEADLRVLAGVTGCVRTYGVSQGLDAVPEIARAFGLRVRLGAWIGADPAANAAELARALDLARRHADVVDLLIVGNEVLLRRELEPAALAALLAQARAAAQVRIAYADVWEFWLRHAGALRGHVDVAAIHVLPYWEDHPVGVDAAVEHVVAVTARTRTALAPLPVWVGETGWPAAGRARGPAVPGVVEQATFVRRLLARARAAGLDFNLIEGFDQPWKRALEGAVGGAWGVFDSHARQRVHFAGPATADPRAWQVIAGAVTGAAIGVLATLRMARGAAGGLLAGLGGALVGALAVLHGRMALLECRDAISCALGAALWLLVAACSLAFALRPDARGAATLRAAWLFAAAAYALILVFDGRYRPLAWPALAGPALLACCLPTLSHGLRALRDAERVPALVCLIAAPPIVILEGWRNVDAWLVATCLGLAGGTALAGHRRLPPETASAASSTAPAAGTAL